MKVLGAVSVNFEGYCAHRELILRRSTNASLRHAAVASSEWNMRSHTFPLARCLCGSTFKPGQLFLTDSGRQDNSKELNITSRFILAAHVLCNDRRSWWRGCSRICAPRKTIFVLTTPPSSGLVLRLFTPNRQISPCIMRMRRFRGNRGKVLVQKVQMERFVWEGTNVLSPVAWPAGFGGTLIEIGLFRTL